MREWIEICSSSPFFELFTSIVNRLGIPTVTFSQLYRKNRSQFSEGNCNTGLFLTEINPSQTWHCDQFRMTCNKELFFYFIFNSLRCFYMKRNKIIEENISEFMRWLEKCSLINCINLAWGRFEPRLSRDTFGSFCILL